MFITVIYKFAISLSVSSTLHLTTAFCRTVHFRQCMILIIYTATTASHVCTLKQNMATPTRLKKLTVGCI